MFSYWGIPEELLLGRGLENGPWFIGQGFKAFLAIFITLSLVLNILKQRQRLGEMCRQDDPSLAQLHTDQLLLCQLNKTDFTEKHLPSQ